MIYQVAHHIAGQSYQEATSLGHDIYNPAQGEKIGRVHFANPSICERAIKAAKEAFPSWSETPPMKRVQVLFKFRELLEKNKTELARLITEEHGKACEDAKGSVARAIELVELHCGLMCQYQGIFSANVSSRMDCTTIKQPLGVCAGVSPFNFPVMVPVWEIIPAIACGNTFILKPSEQAPSAPVRLLELLTEAGLPAGVANCIHGDKTTVTYLLNHPDIQAFTAVASTPVAKSIYQQAILSNKRAHTFGSAKNHAVVMIDADLDMAAKAILGAAYGSAGERCMALSVVVAVGDKTCDALINRLLPMIQKITIDAGDVPGCDMGPLISQAHRDRVMAMVDVGVSEGASLLVDGRDFQHPKLPRGFFMGPCLFDHVTEEMTIYQQEIFGPVLSIVRVHDFEEALDLVNRNPYGNGTAIFTREGYIAREFSERVQVGMVGINVPIPVPVASHPFGGWKASSFGDTVMHGMESIHFYTKLKSITTKWPTSGQHEDAFVMPSHR